MDRHQVEVAVLKVLAAVLQCQVDVKSARDNTPEWDSIKHIEIIFAVEDELGFEFSGENMAAFDSVVGIVDAATNSQADSMK